ncbi:MAG: hypothetical protein ACK4GC_10640 [Paracoccaceae bacterium]
MRLDGPHEQADTRLLPHGELVQLHCFASQRLNARNEWLSVGVMFNHEGDAFGASQSLIEAALGVTIPEPAAIPDNWDGQWLAWAQMQKACPPRPSRG